MMSWCTGPHFQSKGLAALRQYLSLPATYFYHLYSSIACLSFWITIASASQQQTASTFISQFIFSTPPHFNYCSRIKLNMNEGHLSPSFISVSRTDSRPLLSTASTTSPVVSEREHPITVVKCEPVDDSASVSSLSKTTKTAPIMPIRQIANLTGRQSLKRPLPSVVGLAADASCSSPYAKQSYVPLSPITPRPGYGVTSNPQSSGVLPPAPQPQKLLPRTLQSCAYCFTRRLTSPRCSSSRIEIFAHPSLAKSTQHNGLST